jgi:hypothetical protein
MAGESRGTELAMIESDGANPSVAGAGVPPNLADGSIWFESLSAPDSAKLFDCEAARDGPNAAESWAAVGGKEPDLATPGESGGQSDGSKASDSSGDSDSVHPSDCANESDERKGAETVGIAVAASSAEYSGASVRRRFEETLIGDDVSNAREPGNAAVGAKPADGTNGTEAVPVGV